MDDASHGDRMASARRRARVAKAGMLAAALAVFAGGLVLTRSTAAGHTKTGARPLAAPDRFLTTVRRSALSGGSIAPPQQPPQASTATS
jgi:hypothetical protein